MDRVLGATIRIPDAVRRPQRFVNGIVAGVGRRKRSLERISALALRDNELIFTWVDA